MPLPHRSRAVDPASGERVRALLGPRPAVIRGWVPGASTVAPAPGRHVRPGPPPPPPVSEDEDEEEDERSRHDAPAAGRHRSSAPAHDAVDRERRPAGAAPAPGLLDRWRGSRVDPGGRGVAALALVAVLAALLAGSVVVRGRPQEVPPPPVVAPGAPLPGASAPGGPVPGGGVPGAPLATGPAGAPPGAPSTDVVVAVAGKVQSPGLVRLPVGSRVDDAVRAAGGPLPGVDLVEVNLARRLVDGEQVLVGVPQPPAAPGQPDPGPGRPAAPVAGGLVDLNTATAAQLDDLPGLGPVLAQRVVDHRSDRGAFASVEQLREVEGIGESKFAQLRELVRV